MVTLANPTSRRRRQPHPRTARILRAQPRRGTSAFSGPTAVSSNSPPFSSPMGISREASGPANGKYSVTCEAELNLSDGTSVTGNLASDTFLVSGLTVNVTGDPYVVIPGDGTHDSDTTSSYTATAQSSLYNDNGFFHYTWVGPNAIWVVH